MCMMKNMLVSGDASKPSASWEMDRDEMKRDEISLESVLDIIDALFIFIITKNDFLIILFLRDVKSFQNSKKILNS